MKKLVKKLKMIWKTDGSVQENYRKYGSKWKYIKVFFFPSFLFKKRTLQLLGELKGVDHFLEQITLPLTVRCTLNCKHCANLMQYYDEVQKIDVPVEEQLEFITKVLHNVGFVINFHVIGGEPFVYKGLTEVISHLVQFENIGRIVIITNGTVVPQDTFLKSIQGKNVVIRISNYGKLSTKKDIIIAKLKDYSIPFEVGEEHVVWQDYGTLKLYQRTTEEYKNQYRKCWIPCRTLFKCKLHVCPRSAHGVDLGAIPDNPDDYIDLNREDMTPQLFAELYAKLESKDYIEACKYCKMGTGKLEEFPAAEQMPRI